MQLVQTVRQTYYNRFNEMDLEYRLHFASRLYAWGKTNDAKELLDNIRPEVVPINHEMRKKRIFAIQEELLVKDYIRDVNNYDLRKPFFDKYPKLLLLHNALFIIRHWLCIYKIDERKTLYKLISKIEISKLINELLMDTTAQKTLSTYFINTIYLYEKLYKSELTPVLNPGSFIELAKLYDYDSASDIQIHIYLYTHCILGETLFYYKPISQNLEIYLYMLKNLEKIIYNYYDSINLDNKFEFLVCARICKYKSFIESLIYQEAENSVNNEGFIVDKHNTNINPQKQSFMMSEHRNVLFIMSYEDPVFIK